MRRDSVRYDSHRNQSSQSEPQSLEFGRWMNSDDRKRDPSLSSRRCVKRKDSSNQQRAGSGGAGRASPVTGSCRQRLCDAVGGPSSTLPQSCCFRQLFSSDAVLGQSVELIQFGSQEGKKARIVLVRTRLLTFQHSTTNHLGHERLPPIVSLGETFPNVLHGRGVLRTCSSRESG